MRVLLADDDPVSRRQCQALMEQWGYSVQPARSGDEAWEVLDSGQRPSLAVLDWSMPGLTGVELCRRLRAQLARPYVYVLLVTGREGVGDMVEGFRAGADDYVTKPLEPRELRARLHAAVRILEMQRELSQIYNTAPTGMILLDPERKIRKANPAGCSMARLDEEQLVGRRIGEALGCAFVDEDDCRDDIHEECLSCQVRRLIEEAFTAGRECHRQEVSLTLDTPQGRCEVSYLASLRHLSRDGQPRALLCLEDITPQKRTENKLKGTVRELAGFNQIAIDRELRMIELKRQVNELCRRLGQPEPHDVSFVEGPLPVLSDAPDPARQPTWTISP